LPGYTAGAGGTDDGHPRDEKEGYSRPLVQESTDNLHNPLNPFSDRNETGAGGNQGYLPPAGPPPGLERYGNDRNKDEGFDPIAIEAAMRASETETKGPGNNTGGAGPSSSAR
jgi:hypothetical protein